MSALVLGGIGAAALVVPGTAPVGWLGVGPVAATSTGTTVADAAAAGAATKPGSVSGPAATSLAAATAAADRRTRAEATASAQQEFTRTVSAYLSSRSGSVGVIAVDVGSGVVVSSSPHTATYTASIVKLDILAVLLLQRQDQGRLPTSAERSLARRMITVSDNAAATELYRRIAGASGLAKANRRLGLRETVPGSGGVWGLTRTTAADQLRLLSVVTGSGGALVQAGLAGKVGVLGAAQRGYALGLMEQVDDAQAWGVSAAAGDARTALKNGWLPYSKDGYRWLVNSVGLVHTAQGRTLLLAVLSRRSPSQPYAVATVEHVSRLAASALSVG